MGGNTGSRIVRTYCDVNASTGESERWVDEEGRTWAADMRLGYRTNDTQTGEQRGTVSGGKIYPR